MQFFLHLTTFSFNRKITIYLEVSFSGLNSGVFRNLV